MSFLFFVTLFYMLRVESMKVQKSARKQERSQPTPCDDLHSVLQSDITCRSPAHRYPPS